MSISSLRDSLRGDFTSPFEQGYRRALRDAEAALINVLPADDESAILRTAAAILYRRAEEAAMNPRRTGGRAKLLADAAEVARLEGEKTP